MLSSYSWLPSERKWIDVVSEDLLVGERVLVRSLPRWGVTSLFRHIAIELGDSAVYLDAGAVDENSQKDFRTQVQKEVLRRVEDHGCAQLILDNYGRALRRSQGGALHSMLYALLVDSPRAADIGALLGARFSDLLDLRFSGSPLISRTISRPLPVLAVDDAEVLGYPLCELVEQFGESTSLARKKLKLTDRELRASMFDALRADRSRIVTALPPDARRILAGDVRNNSLDAVSEEALRCIGNFDADGAFTISRAWESAGLIQELEVQSPSWPGELNESVERFAELCGDEAAAMWIDRYIFSDPNAARRFLLKFRQRSTTHLKLLVSDESDPYGAREDVASALEGIKDVEVRFMTRQDRHDLHDRHLVFPTASSGYVLPTAGVVCAVDRPGSAISVQMSGLQFDYRACWSRASRAWPSSA